VNPVTLQTPEKKKKREGESVLPEHNAAASKKEETSNGGETGSSFNSAPRAARWDQKDREIIGPASPGRKITNAIPGWGWPRVFEEKISNPEALVWGVRSAFKDFAGAEDQQPPTPKPPSATAYVNKTQDCRLATLLRLFHLSFRFKNFWLLLPTNGRLLFL
jgi:hypothetical protein